MGSKYSALVKKNATELKKKSGVHGVGVGKKIRNGVVTNTMSLVCFVEEKQPLSSLAIKDRVPNILDGTPTDVVVKKPVKALATTDRHRPAPGGVSIGHYSITAGTLGCLVWYEDQLHILSNNHVLANSNDADLGDDILQPGPHDGGKRPDDIIAKLTKFIPISFGGITPPTDCSIGKLIASIINIPARLAGRNTRLMAVAPQTETDNLVDAAIAKPINDNDVTSSILELGIITGVGSGSVGDVIKKSGRTTNVTKGEIEYEAVIVDVGYGDNKVATFTDQFMAGAMSAGGDSGSVILNESNEIVGLLFAGSDDSTIISRIEHVVDQLGITIVTAQ